MENNTLTAIKSWIAAVVMLTAFYGWKDCTAVSDDSVIYTLYDGKQNYVAKVNVASGAVDLNVGNKNDKDLVALMQSYVDAFMERYK